MTYFFYPETTRRSLEEMDRIFHKTTSIFNLVRTAEQEPHMYGKKGELLLTVDDVEDEAVKAVRNTSVSHKEHKEHIEHDKSADNSDRT